MSEQESLPNVLDTAMTALESNLPTVFARSSVHSLFGGTISPGTLANLGEAGPPYFILNRHVTYEKSSFLEWLRTKAEHAKG